MKSGIKSKPKRNKKNAPNGAFFGVSGKPRPCGGADETERKRRSNRGRVILLVVLPAPASCGVSLALCGPAARAGLNNRFLRFVLFCDIFIDNYKKLCILTCEKYRSKNMSDKIITSYDIMLTDMRTAYGQVPMNARIAVVTDDFSYIDDDPHDYVHDPELGDEVFVSCNGHNSQIGDVVAYEIRNGGAMIVKNFTREPKEQIIKNFDRAYNVVFGPGYNRGKGSK